MCCWDDFLLDLYLEIAGIFMVRFVIPRCLFVSISEARICSAQRKAPGCRTALYLASWSLCVLWSLLSKSVPVHSFNYNFYILLGGRSRDHPPEEGFPDKMLETNTESLDSWTIQETRKEPSTGKGNKGLEGWGRAGYGWWERERGTSRRGG